VSVNAFERRTGVTALWRPRAFKVSRATISGSIAVLICMVARASKPLRKVPERMHVRRSRAAAIRSRVPQPGFVRKPSSQRRNFGLPLTFVYLRPPEFVELPVSGKSTEIAKMQTRDRSIVAAHDFLEHSGNDICADAVHLPEIVHAREGFVLTPNRPGPIIKSELLEVVEQRPPAVESATRASSPTVSSSFKRCRIALRSCSQTVCAVRFAVTKAGSVNYEKEFNGA